jgi:hypothetical protein
VGSSAQDRPAAEDAPVDRPGPPCALQGFRDLPDVRITPVTKESETVPDCKVADVIGAETNFELLLPDDWNGKLVMGGGGGFVGRVVNMALLFGLLQSGYATVGSSIVVDVRCQPDSTYIGNNGASIQS